LRRHLPDTFLNIRLDPVSLCSMPLENVREEIRQRVQASGNPALTGVCCINMDHTMPYETVACIFETVAMCREEVL